MLPGVFYTTTHFSYYAKKIAEDFGILLHDKYAMPSRFPIVKCKYREHHYYLPCDWNYLTLRLNLNNGDCYCLTIEEAEQKVLLGSINKI